jgi:hypothetical protein
MGDDGRSNLAGALTFHAGFDRGADADFALGDRTIYSVHPETGALAAGLGDPPLAVVAGRGRFGGALAFGLENSHVVAYRAHRNVAYTPEQFRGTVSFWLSLEPSDIPGQYCDPFQLTDKDYSDACVWLDFTKNDTPSDFRLGVFGDRAEWDVKRTGSDGQEFYWRLLKIAEPPFARDRWTHVAVTWDGLNSSRSGRARLFLDGVDRGATGVIRERFSWDVARALIRLGTGRYVGLIDDLAFFNRALSAAEVGALHGLERGVAELHGAG